MRRLVLVALCAAVPAAAVARAAAHHPSVGSPQAAEVGRHDAQLSAVVDTAGLDGTLDAAYGASSVTTTRVRLARIPHGGKPGRVGGAVTGLRPGTTYRYRLLLTTADGTVQTSDATFTTARATVEATSACRVPRLRGRALGAARRALRRAGCATGHVRRPAHVRRGRHLVVRWQSVPAGRVRPAGTRVDLRLGAAR
jgi:hypothetical protein